MGFLLRKAFRLARYQIAATMRIRPAVPPTTPPTMVPVWDGVGDGVGDEVGLFVVAEEVNGVAVELDAGEDELPAVIVIKTGGAEEVEPSAAFNKKVGIKLGGSAETEALLEEVTYGFTFVVVPFTTQTP